MTIKTAIIPVAGYGTRRLPITKAIEKCMLPIGNRPIVDYIVEDCVLAGVTDICFVINATKYSQLKQYYSKNQPLEDFMVERGKDPEILQTAPAGVTFHYVTQPADQFGTAVAVAAAIKELGLKEQVAMRNGDDPFWNAPGGSEMKHFFSHISGDDEAAIIGVERPKKEMTKYGMLVVEDNMLKQIIEKPSLDKVTSKHANVNGYVFSPRLLEMIVDYVDSHDFGPKDQEYMITDPVTEYVKAGHPMRVVPAVGEWLDSGSLAGWLHANEIIGRDLLK